MAQTANGIITVTFPGNMAFTYRLAFPTSPHMESFVVVSIPASLNVRQLVS